MPTTGDTYRCAVHWTMPEQVDAYNIIGLRMLAGTCTDTELLAAVSTYIAAAFAQVDDIMSSGVDMAECQLSKVVWSVDKWVVDTVVGTFFPSFTSTNISHMLPHQCSGVVTFPTAKPKRRGRIFIPGFTEGDQQDSLWSTAAATAMAALSTTILSGFTAGSGSFNYHVLGNDGTATYPTSGSVNGLVGSTDRRKPGVGV